MKKIRQKFIKTVLFTLGSISLVACGGSGTNKAPSEDSNTSNNSSSLVDTTAPVFNSSASFVIQENERTSFFLSATDENEVTYSISEGDTSSFTINESSGKVSLREVPNYEKKSTYTFVATATDSRANASTQNVTVSITDVEESIGKFVISINTEEVGESSSVEFIVPTNTTSFPDGYNYNVDCDNDGINEATEVRGDYTCSYEQEGVYRIAIEGDFPQIDFFRGGDKKKLLSIEQWGDIEWKSMLSSFYGCTNLAGQAKDTPNLSAVVSTVGMFTNASAFDQNISDWDVSNIKKMDAMFAGATSFNQDIGSWNVSNVESMDSMFSGASSFNQDLSSWNVVKVQSMRYMFKNANVFDQNIGVWQPYATRYMNGMFDGVSLSSENYKLLLLGWAFKKSHLQRGVHFSAGNSRLPLTVVGVHVITDVEAKNAKNELLDGTDGPEWYISDGG